MKTSFFTVLAVCLSLALIGLTINGISSNASANYVGVLTWGSQQKGIGPLEQPYDVAVNSSSLTVFVADTGNNRIVEYVLADPCLKGTKKIVSKVCFVKEWGSNGTSPGEFKLPRGIALDSSGNVFVADTDNDRIQQFHLSNPCLKGTQVVLGVCFINEWGTTGNGTGEFSRPYDLTVDSSGEVFVADTFNNRIQEFQLNSPCPSGATLLVSGVCFIREWGSRGISDGQFDFTGNAALDSSGKVYVSDVNNHRIQVFELVNICPATTKQIVTGVCKVTEWGKFGIVNGQFQFLPSLDIDSSGQVYAVDYQNNRIQKFQLANPCPTNTLFVVTGVCHIENIGTPGQGIGQLSGPWGLDVVSPQYLFVAETWNNRIQIFQGDSPPQPPFSHLPRK